MSLRMAALGLIAQHPRSTGYDLLRVFERSLANVWPASQSQLYGELNRLTGDGLIEVVASGPRGRKEYEATAAGHTALREWLLDENSEPMRFALMLKVFLLTELGSDGARRYLDLVASGTGEHLRSLETLESKVDWSDTTQDQLGRIVLEWGKRLCQMKIEWAGWAAAELERKGD